jgi:hypothetical protein
MIKDAGQFNLMVERVQPPVAARGSLQTYAVARADGTATGRVLALLPSADVTTLAVDGAQCIALDNNISAEAALHVPALALSLWAWDQMQLEIGEAAVYTPDSPFPHFLGQAALLRGALPVIQLGTSSTYQPPAHVDVMNSAESSALLNELKGRLADCVGAAAIDASGKAEITDVIFETLPRWGRLLLAAQRPTPINIDFYNNVHRKGIDMRGCSFDPLQVFDPALRANYDGFVQSAIKLLTRRPETILAKRT